MEGKMRDSYKTFLLKIHLFKKCYIFWTEEKLIYIK